MLQFNSDKKQQKGWFFGPWNSEVPVPVGYANEGVNEEHYHQQMFEIYLVAQGQSTIIVNNAEFVLRQGDALVVEPGEVHTFTSSSKDYLHFVIHTPFIQGDKIITQQRSRGNDLDTS